MTVALGSAPNSRSHYWDTNPGMIRQAAHALAQILADVPAGKHVLGRAAG